MRTLCIVLLLLAATFAFTEAAEVEKRLLGLLGAVDLSVTVKSVLDIANILPGVLGSIAVLLFEMVGAINTLIKSLSEKALGIVTSLLDTVLGSVKTALILATSVLGTSLKVVDTIAVLATSILAGLLGAVGGKPGNQ